MREKKMNLEGKQRSDRRNRGFSLVELLVAMIILAIVVTPLLRSFVVAARTNAKARKVIQANTSVQNLMEEIKGDPLADVLRAVNGFNKDEKGETIHVSLPSSGFEAVLNGGSYTAVSAANSAVSAITETDAGGTVIVTGSTFTPNSSGEYHVVLDGITNGHSTYDALLTLTADSSKTLDNPDILSMNRKDCGYYLQPGEQSINAASVFADSNASYKSANPDLNISSRSADEMLSTMTRQMTVDITKDNASGYVTVNLKSVYDCGAGLTDPADRKIEENNLVFNNYGSGQDMKNVYIYYYPLYNSGPSARDSIIINNTSNLDVGVYLICMRDTATATAFLESNYKADLELQETDAAAFHTRVCTNVDSSHFTINDHNTGLNLALKDLGNTTSEEVLYRVNVELLNHNDASFTTDGAGNRVFTLNAADHITTYEGTVLDNSVQGN